MKLTPRQFTEQARVWNETLSDSVVSFPALKYLGGNKLGINETTLEGPVEGGYMNDVSSAQFDEMLHVPHRWITSEHCPDELRSLITDYKMGHLSTKQLNDRVLVRKRTIGTLSDKRVRALLSDQYTPLDNFDLASSIEDALGEQGINDAVVLRAEVGDVMRAYIMLPNIRFDAERPGTSADGAGSGGLHPAIYINNNEIGRGAVHIAGGLYRSYCENGMIIGWRETSHDKLIHRWVTKRLLAMHAAEYLAIALNLSEKAALRYIQLQGIKVAPSSLKSIIESWAATYGLTAQAEDWLKACVSMSERTELSMFDVINEATYLAKAQASEVREQMEIMAGDMLQI